MMGHWVTRRGGIKVFVKATQPPPPPPPIKHDMTRLVACPVCHAKVTETCKNPNGYVRPRHPERFTPRLCPCGGDLAQGRRLCEECRVESDRAASRDHKRRVRAKRADVAA